MRLRSANEPKRKKLPLVIAVVVYHGKNRWTTPTELSELIHLSDKDRKVFAPLLPKLRFVLDDLTAQRRTELEARSLPPAAKLTLLALRDIRNTADACAWLESASPLVRALVAEPQGEQAFATIIKYILTIRAKTDVEELTATAERIAGAGETIMSTARQLIQQGIKEGFEKGAKEGFEKGVEEGVERGIKKGFGKGIEKGARDLLLRQLKLRFRPLPNSIHERVEKANKKELERWGAKIVRAQRLEDIFE